MKVILTDSGYKDGTVNVEVPTLNMYFCTINESLKNISATLRLAIARDKGLNQAFSADFEFENKVTWGELYDHST